MSNMSNITVDYEKLKQVLFLTTVARNIARIDGKESLCEYLNEAMHILETMILAFSLDSI
jgi:hypothetical protein